MKVIKIRSQREGFRRCGIAHSTEWTEYPAGKFNKKELSRLKNEPMLWVEEEDQKPPKPKDPPKGSGEGSGEGSEGSGEGGPTVPVPPGPADNADS